MEIADLFNTIKILHPLIACGDLVRRDDGDDGDAVGGVRNAHYTLADMSAFLAQVNQAFANFGFAHVFALGQTFAGIEIVSPSRLSSCRLRFMQYSGTWPARDFSRAHIEGEEDRDAQVLFHDNHEAPLLLQFGSIIHCNDLPNFFGWSDIEKQIVQKTFERHFRVRFYPAAQPTQDI